MHIIDHPRELNLGGISLIFNRICDAIESKGFLIDCGRNKDGTIKTFQTMQIYLKNEDYVRVHGYPFPSKVQPALGAIQYEGSNDFTVRLPNTVNWRFYRKNLPESWKAELEQLDSGFRRDTNDGPPINQNAQSIAFKFFSNDERSSQFILNLSMLLERLLNKR